MDQHEPNLPLDFVDLLEISRRQGDTRADRIAIHCHAAELDVQPVMVVLRLVEQDPIPAGNVGLARCHDLHGRHRSLDASLQAG